MIKAIGPKVEVEVEGLVPIEQLTYYYNTVVRYYYAFYFENDYQTALEYLDKARVAYKKYISWGGTETWQSFYELLINQGVNKLI